LVNDVGQELFSSPKAILWGWASVLLRWLQAEWLQHVFPFAVVNDLY